MAMIPKEQIDLLNTIHHVDGFDPAAFAVEYTDLNTGEVRKRIPVMIQIAWFRLVYREGKISVTVEQKQDYFVAKARVYPNYKDPADCYLAEATACRGPDPTKPSISPREWAQTAAVGVALRNAGFGVQFNAAGDEFPAQAPNEFSDEELPFDGMAPAAPASAPAAPNVPPVPRELTPEEKYAKALQVPCPIGKYSGKTLGEVMMLDPKAINWVAKKFGENDEAGIAARTICEYAVQNASA